MSNQMTFRYKLTYEEAYETFYLLALKWNKKTKMAVGVVLTALAVGLLIAYYLDSRKIHYFYIAILTVLLLFYLIYAPVIRGKHGARKVMRAGGTYGVSLTKDGRVVMADGSSIDMAGDKNARFIETASSFIIRADNIHTFCLPKRIMSDAEILEVRELLKDSIS